MLLILGKTLPTLLFPLGFALWTMAFALVALVLNKRAMALFVGIGSWIWLFAASTPPVADRLITPLESPYYSKALPDSAPAIVLLGGASVPAASSRPHPETNLFGDRILHAARLWKQGKSPRLITTGGRIAWIRKAGGSEAHDYAQLLTELFDVPQEAITECPGSLTTREDALEVEKLFTEKRWPKEILLVTSAFHMRRAAALFRKQGFTVHEAATDFFTDSDKRFQFIHLLPQEGALQITFLAMHEWIGYLAYRAFGWI
jgi:uncharacterized SAM-binding protein YcdF (DUF218 family)